MAPFLRVQNAEKYELSIIVLNTSHLAITFQTINNYAIFTNFKVTAYALKFGISVWNLTCVLFVSKPL